jgi:hypothetical protein
VVTGSKCKARNEKSNSPKYFVRYIYSSIYQSDILFEPLTRFKPLEDKRYKLNCLWALGNTLDAHWRFNISYTDKANSYKIGD